MKSGITLLDNGNNNNNNNDDDNSKLCVCLLTPRQAVSLIVAGGDDFLVWSVVSSHEQPAMGSPPAGRGANSPSR
jgi:hypothetical protein